MSKIVSIHSFRGGTGKSNTTANLAVLLAQNGRRVGIIDTDIQSPGIHILFGFSGHEIADSLNDYLWDNCTIREAAKDVTDRLTDADGNLPATGRLTGRIYLIPASIKPGEIGRVLRQGYDVNRLATGIKDILSHLKLDVLLIDTHPGLNEETLLSIALSNTLLVVMRPDEQDFEGTGVTVQVAQRLEVRNLRIVVNKTPSTYDFEQVRQQVTAAYGCPVAAVLPHADEMMALASRGLFVRRHPTHPLSHAYGRIADQL